MLLAVAELAVVHLQNPPGGPHPLGSLGALQEPDRRGESLQLRGAGEVGDIRALGVAVGAAVELGDHQDVDLTAAGEGLEGDGPMGQLQGGVRP